MQESICFVKHNNSGAGKTDSGVISGIEDMIGQASWRSYHDMRSLHEGNCLWPHICSSHNQDSLERLWRTKCLKLFIDLQSKFSCWCKHNGIYSKRILRPFLEDRDCKSHSLPCSRPTPSDTVPPSQYLWYSSFLDCGRLLDLHCGERLDKPWRYI